MVISCREIREIFIEFFKEKGHLHIPAASLVPVNDPTLLFVNSGMAPLKRYFTGEAEPPHPDLCNVQPCIRTRDIDDVGDRHHLTFFEMMGSWSINNYFKERAIELAYELLVERFGLPKEKLYATVYRGNSELSLSPDYESAKGWEKVGLKSERIVYLGDEVFWGPAGDSGPCGPCTDVFFDTGNECVEASNPEGHFDPERFLQIWNAGNFMELDKRPDGTYSKLRFQSVDSGSGLERMATIVNGFSTVYETDFLRPILTDVEQQLPGRGLSEADFRVLTDHIRAVTFMLSEGVVPTNEGRGHIPRRLIRKCVAVVIRAGAPEFDFAGVINGIIERSSEDYPLLAKNRLRIIEKFLNEKKAFERVLRGGFDRLRRLCEKPPSILTGVDAFALSSTYGMPIELIRDFIRDRGWRCDEEGYYREFRRHQDISRAGRLTAKGA